MTGRVALAVLVGLIVLQASPAGASCAAEPEENISRAPIVLVGTVAQVRTGLAQIEVEAVLAGPDLAPRVWVQGGQDQPPFPLNQLSGAGSSGDVSWTPGRRYAISAARDFRTNSCEVSEAPRRVLATADPDDVGAPVADGSPGFPVGGTSIGTVFLVVGVLAVAGVVLVLWATRRRRGRTIGA